MGNLDQIKPGKVSVNKEKIENSILASGWGNSAKKTENSEVRVNCQECGKTMNRKSLKKHMETVHAPGKNSAIPVLKASDTKRKSDKALSPPKDEPAPKKNDLT